jgi:hypothetical protein
MERNAFYPNMKTFVRKYFQLTKVAIVSHVNFNFES